MELYPAIDLHDRGAVRLVQGDFGRVRGYGDPVALARSYVAGGAPWIHVVDLDAARTGEPVNRDVVLEIAAAVDVKVQAGGGVRGPADAAALLDHGIERVVLGTAALETPELVETLAAQLSGACGGGPRPPGRRRRAGRARLGAIRGDHARARPLIDWRRWTSGRWWSPPSTVTACSVAPTWWGCGPRSS